MSTFAITVKVRQLSPDRASAKTHVGGRLWGLFNEDKIGYYRVKAVELRGRSGLRHEFDVHATVDAESRKALYATLLETFGIGGALIDFGGIVTSVEAIEAA